MFFVEFLFAVAFALAIAFLFVLVVGRAPPSRSGTVLPFVWLFVILLFTMWAGGAWIGPAGPVIFGVAWMPFLVVGLIVALIIAAATESAQRRDATVAADGDTSPLLAAFSIITLVLLVALVIAVAAAYVW